MILTIRPATRTDALWLGCNLRAEDRQEVETATGMAAEAVVPASLSSSVACYTMRLAEDGTAAENPALIFGVCKDPRSDGVGIVWLLATDEIKRAPLSILREATYWIRAWQEQYPVLHNIVDTRNTLHVRWLQLLGFTLGERYDIHGHSFVHAIRKDTNV